MYAEKQRGQLDAEVVIMISLKPNPSINRTCYFEGPRNPPSRRGYVRARYFNGAGDPAFASDFGRRQDIDCNCPQIIHNHVLRFNPGPPGRRLVMIFYL